MEVSQDDFEKLKNDLEDNYHEGERLQRWYSALTGKRWVPQLYLTDVRNRAMRNRATLKPNP